VACGLGAVALKRKLTMAATAATLFMPKTVSGSCWGNVSWKFTDKGRFLACPSDLTLETRRLERPPGKSWAKVSPTDLSTGNTKAPFPGPLK
jgi:hypothetical protein